MDAVVEHPAARLARQRGERDGVAERGEQEAPRVGLEAGQRLGQDAMRVIDRRRRRDRERTAQEVRDRAVGPMRVVWRAARSRDACAARSRIGDDLVDEARLAKAGLGDDRHDATLARERLVERAYEERDLGVAAHERRAPTLSRPGRLRPQETPCDERRGLALRGDGRMRFVREDPRRAAVGRVPDEDLAWLGGLLEPRGDVHGVAEHAELALLVADRAGDGDPRIHADPERQAPAGPPLDPRVRALERAEDRERRVLRLLGMTLILVDRAEHRDDGVADVFLDEPAVGADLRRDRVPGRAHVLVQLLGERGESRDVGEEDRDLPGLAFDLARRFETRPASSAVHVVRGHARAAFRAGHVGSPDHVPSQRIGRRSLPECRVGV